MPIRCGNRRSSAVAATSIVILALLGTPRNPAPGLERSGGPPVAESGQRVALVAAASDGEPGDHRAAPRHLWAGESDTDAGVGVVDVVSDLGDGHGRAGTAIVIGDGYLVTAAHSSTVPPGPVPSRASG